LTSFEHLCMTLNEGEGGKKRREKLRSKLKGGGGEKEGTRARMDLLNFQPAKEGGGKRGGNQSGSEKEKGGGKKKGGVGLLRRFLAPTHRRKKKKGGGGEGGNTPFRKRSGKKGKFADFSAACMRPYVERKKKKSKNGNREKKKKGRKR